MCRTDWPLPSVCEDLWPVADPLSSTKWFDNREMYWSGQSSGKRVKSLTHSFVSAGRVALPILEGSSFSHHLYTFVWQQVQIKWKKYTISNGLLEQYIDVFSDLTPWHLDNIIISTFPKLLPVVWLKITTFLRIGDLCCHGHNNNHVIKVREQLWSQLQETNIDCRLETWT